jgi:Na+-transporting methylmalonyl-CoA/oxaloacetate decarboxylase gamma subunit
VDRDSLLLLVKLLFAGMGVVALILFVIYPLWRVLRVKPDDSLLMRTFELPEEEDEVQIPEDGKKPDRNVMLAEARGRPVVTAQLVKQWLREKK